LASRPLNPDSQINLLLFRLVPQFLRPAGEGEATVAEDVNAVSDLQDFEDLQLHNIYRDVVVAADLLDAVKCFGNERRGEANG
jgi:hypothetical protein